MAASPEELFGHWARVGLNIHGTLPLDALSPELRAALVQAVPDLPSGGSLWVLGHQGPAMWQHLCALWGADWPRRTRSPHPLDDWARETVSRTLSAQGLAHRILFPTTDQTGAATASPLPLQRLGEALGWHHASPFLVGIDAQWGSWFAYRVVAWVAQVMPASSPRALGHVCDTCTHRACERACPAQALTPQWQLRSCVDHRLRVGSSCAQTCWAREACPVAADQAYPPEQLAYHYGQSLAFIRQWVGTSGGAP